MFEPDENICPRSNMIVSHYVIDGAPIPLKRPRFGLGHVYDPQKKLKFGVALQLRGQQKVPILSGPLKLSVIFYMPIPIRALKKLKQNPRAPHYIKPDIDNLIKWLLDISNKILFEDDSQIAVIEASKYYSTIPRTEFTLMTINPEKP